MRLIHCHIDKGMVYEQLFDKAEANELSQKLHGTVTRQTTQTGKAVQREGLWSCGQELQ